MASLCVVAEVVDYQEHLSVCSPEARSESFLGIDEGFDTVVHVLSELNFVAAKAAHVRNVKDTVVGLSVLAMSSTNLHVVLVGDNLHLFGLLLELGKVDVDRSAHTSAKIGGAGADVAQVSVVLELSDCLDL